MRSKERPSVFWEDAFEPRMARMSAVYASVAELARSSGVGRAAIGRFGIFRYGARFFTRLASVMLLAIVPAFGEAIDEVMREDGLEVRFRMSETAITTAERITVTIDAKSEDGVPSTSEKIGNMLGGFRVRDAIVSEPGHDASGRAVTMQWRFLLEPYLPGTYTVPPVKVTRREGSEDVVVETPSIAVAVRSLFPADEEAPKLKPLAAPVRDFGSWLPIVLLVILAPPCVALVLRLLRGRERRGAAMADAEKPPPHKAALAELESIGRESGGADRLQEVLCRYLQFRFNQRTRGHSIEELSGRLELEASARFTYERLAEQLQRARYGREEVADRAASSARDLLEEFVRQTAPPELRRQEA